MLHKKRCSFLKVGKSNQAIKSGIHFFCNYSTDEHEMATILHGITNDDMYQSLSTTLLYRKKIKTTDEMSYVDIQDLEKESS